MLCLWFFLYLLFLTSIHFCHLLKPVIHNIVVSSYLLLPILTCFDLFLSWLRVTCFCFLVCLVIFYWILNLVKKGVSFFFLFFNLIQKLLKERSPNVLREKKSSLYLGLSYKTEYLLSPVIPSSKSWKLEAVSRTPDSNMHVLEAGA